MPMNVAIVFNSRRPSAGIIPTLLRRIKVTYTFVSRYDFSRFRRHNPQNPIVLLGGFRSASDPLDDDTILFLKKLEHAIIAGAPVLGICLGAQLLARIGGAIVRRHPSGIREIGYQPVHPVHTGTIGLFPPSTYYHWHYDVMDGLPQDTVFLRSEHTPIQAFKLDRRLIGVQFHPEINLRTILRWTKIEGHRLKEPDIQEPAEQLRLHALYQHENALILERVLRDWLTQPR